MNRFNSVFGLAIVLFGFAYLQSPTNAIPLSHGPKIPLRQGTSTNWSGYAAETNLAAPQKNAVSDVQGQWIVPTVACTPTATYSSIWVGIDGYSDSTVEQIGTEQDCRNGHPVYSAWYEMYPKRSYPVNIAVTAGDTMSAQVTYSGTNQFTLTLKNLTTGQMFTTKQKARALRQSAEWIVEAPSAGGVLPLANFGTASLTHAQATINGVTDSITGWPNDPITMVNGQGDPKATPSALSPDGQSFSVAWNSN